MKTIWNIKEYILDLEQLVNIDSNSYDKEGILNVVNFMNDKFNKLGWNIKLYQKDDTANTCMEISNHHNEEIDVLFVGHMDTVFPKGTAEKRAFTRDEKKAYGPGVADMKSGLLSIYYLCEQLNKDKTKLSITVAFNGDEEIGSPNSVSWLQSIGKRSKCCFVMEAGRENGSFVKNRKGCADLKLTFEGKAAHAGVEPEKGASAVIAMANWLIELNKLNDYTKGISVNTGVVSGGTASNVVPDRAECLIDLRFKNAEDFLHIKEEVKKLSDKEFVEGVTVKSVYLSSFLPMILNKKAEALIEMVEKSGKKLGIPVTWTETGGASDANNISCLEIPTICGCGPCGGKYHSEEEFLFLDSIEQRLEVLYDVLKQMEKNKENGENLLKT